MIAAKSESGKACKTEKYGITGHIYTNYGRIKKNGDLANYEPPRWQVNIQRSFEN
jgi:hypothetical protein